MQLDDAEYSIPHVDMMPSLESILSELDTDSDIISDVSARITPTPSIDDRPKSGTMLRHVILQGVTSQITSASVSFKVFFFLLFRNMRHLIITITILYAIGTY